MLALQKQYHAEIEGPYKTLRRPRTTSEVPSTTLVLKGLEV